MEKVRWFTPAGRAGLLGPLLRPWVQDSGLQGRRGPLPPSPFPLTRLKHLAIWDLESEQRLFHTYNVLQKYKLILAAEI